jgi:hypothetical protein
LLFAALAVLACRERAPVAAVQAEPKAISLAHGECATIRTTWQILRPLDDLEGSPTVFVHLYHRDRRTQRTFDHGLQFAWQPQSRREHSFVVCHSELARPIPADPYVLRVGLYDNRSGDRWPLQTAGEELAKSAYGLTEVKIPLERLPSHYTFSGRWSDVPASEATQQHPGGRILTGEGSISVEGAPAPGYLVTLIDVGPGGALADIGEGPHPFAPGSHLIRTPLSHGAAALRILARSSPVALRELGVERVR